MGVGVNTGLNTGLNTKLTFTPMVEGWVHQVWEQSPDGGKTWTSIFDGMYKPRSK